MSTTEDIDYNPGKSIVDLPASDPSHLPCPDLISGEALTREQRERNLYLLGKLREKYGLCTGGSRVS